VIGQQQTMNYIIDTCPLTKFEDILQPFHVGEDAIKWLECIATTEFVQGNEMRKLMANTL